MVLHSIPLETKFCVALECSATKHRTCGTNAVHPTWASRFVWVICQLLLPMGNGQPGWPTLYTTCQGGKFSRCLPNLHPVRLSVADFYMRAIWRPCHHEIFCRVFPFLKIEVSKLLCLIYFRHCHFLLLLADGQMEQNITHAAPLLKSFLEANTPQDTGLLHQSQADE